MWTDVDLAKLAKLIKKYPVGTQERWERIADILQRLPSEVTKMAKKIKDNAYMVPVSQRASQGITGKTFFKCFFHYLFPNFIFNYRIGIKKIDHR
jgi:hypothetical protein